MTRIAVNNNTSSNIAFSFKIMAKEDVSSHDQSNLYLPTSEFNLNVKENKMGHPVLFLMKRDPSLAIGGLVVHVLFRELAEHEQYYGANDLEFDDDASPTVLEIQVDTAQEDDVAHKSQAEEAE